MKKNLLSAAVCGILSCMVFPSIPAWASQNPSPPAIEEVVVTASKFERPIREVATPITVISREDLVLDGASFLPDILRSQVGISGTNSGGAGKVTSIRVRGEEGYRTLVLIDGVKASDPTTTQVMPQMQHFLSSSDIERVEILRGPQGFVYGADAGGVINILTRNIEDGDAGELIVEGGTHNTVKVGGFYAVGSEQADALMSYHHFDTDGFNAWANDTGEDKDGYRNGVFHGKAGWNFSEDTRAQVVLRDLKGVNEYDNCFGDNDCRNQYEQTITRANLRHGQNGHTHEFGISATTVDREFFASGVSTYATEGGTKKIDYAGDFALSPSINIIAGVDWEREHIESGDETMSRQQLGQFTELQTQMLKDFYVNIGYRYDNNSDFDRHLSYRVSAAYLHEPAEGLTLKWRASHGTGFRAPSLSEAAYNSGPWAFGEAANTVLAEENSGGYDVGFDLFWSTDSVFSATYFNQSITDEIYFDLVNFSGYFQSEGKSRSKGIELSVEHALLPRLDVTANATYNDTEQVDGEPRYRRPKMLFNIGMVSRYLNDRLTSAFNIRAVRDVKDFTGEDLDDYETLDFSVRYAVSKALTTSIRVNNLLDDDYQEISDFNTAGRTARVGLTYQF